MAVQIFGQSAGSAVADAAKGVASAAAGSLGDMIDALKKIGAVVSTVTPGTETLAGALRSVGNAVAQNVIPALGTAQRYFMDFAKTLANSAVGQAVGAFGKSLGSMAAAAGVAGAAAVALGEILGGFVAKANPVVFEQFTLAVNDLMAVVGRALVPIFQNVLIPMVRMFADMLMALAPLGSAFAQAMKPVVAVFGVIFEIVGRVLGKLGEVALKLSPAIEAIGNVFVELMKAIQPIYDLLIDLAGGILTEVANQLAEAVKAVVPYVMAFARVVGDLVRQFSVWVRELLAMVGINLSNTPGVQPGSSVGAAVRQAGHSSIDDVVKQAQRASFSLGTASKEDPAAKTASAAEEINKKAADIYNTIQAFANDFPDKVYKWITVDMPNAIIEAGRRTARDVGNRIDRNITGTPDVGTFEAINEAAKQALKQMKDDVRDFGNRLGNSIAKPLNVGGFNLNPLS